MQRAARASQDGPDPSALPVDGNSPEGALGGIGKNLVLAHLKGGLVVGLQSSIKPGTANGFSRSVSDPGQVGGKGLFKEDQVIDHKFNAQQPPRWRHSMHQQLTGVHGTAAEADP